MRRSTWSWLASLALGSALQAQCELQKIHAGSEDTSFRVCAVDGDLAVARSVSTQPRVFVYERTPAGWVAGQELVPSDRAAFLGGDAALDGDTIAIGSSAGWTGTDEAVYVFERSGPGQPFVETAKLVPSSPTALASFGEHLALQGAVLAIGASDLHFSPTGPGNLFVFERASGSWTEVLHVEGGIDAPMGTAVDVEGGTVFAGTWGVGARAYAKHGSSWREVPFAFLPGAVSSIDALGDRVAVAQEVGGSPVDWTIHDRLPGGGWTLWQQIMPHGTDAVSCRLASHDRLLIGDPSFENPPTGAVHVFDEVSGAWTLSTTWLAPGSKAFGEPLVVDGDHLLISDVRDGDFGANAGAVHAWSLSGTGCPTLTADVHGVPSATGGTQTLRIAPGPAFAGHLYVLAGSLSGIWPGTPYATITIPLNPDVYLAYTLLHGGSPPLSGHVGFLDAAGEAIAQVVLPPDPLLAGLHAHHAFGVASPALQIVHVSNPVPLVVP